MNKARSRVLSTPSAKHWSKRGKALLDIHCMKLGNGTRCYYIPMITPSEVRLSQKIMNRKNDDGC